MDRSQCIHQKLLIMLRLIIAVAFAASVQASFRILNGKTAKIEDYPYQASILYGWDQIGGGVIVSPRHILTAAHLKAGLNLPYKFKVRVGSPNFHMLGVIHTVKSFHTYRIPKENEIPVNDIAVITLDNPITFNEQARPIALVPEGEEPRHGQMLTVTGWGGTEFGVDSVELRMARMPCIDRELCNEVWKAKSGGLIKLQNSAFCAGGGTASTFPGDSGGPLVNNKTQLVGIVSWGKHERKWFGYPSVFVNVADSEVQKYIHSRLNAEL